MGWMMDTYSNHAGHDVPAIVTGKPISLGGSQGRREATGAGVAYLAKKYLEDLKIPLNEATAIIQGFGNVGSETATGDAELRNQNHWHLRLYHRHLQSSGHRLKARPRLCASLKKSFGISTAVNRSAMRPCSNRKCTVLAPCALERVITDQTCRQAPVPRPGGRRERSNHQRRRPASSSERDDIEVIPDVLCNAGGVIVSYFEWLQNLAELLLVPRRSYGQALYGILDRAKEAVDYQKRKMKFSRRLAALRPSASSGSRMRKPLAVCSLDPAMTRCPWLPSQHPLYVDYHDTEWGVPSRDPRYLFELICLEGAQAGLSWWTVLQKRERYRQVFHQFDPVAVAAMTDDELEGLVTDPGIIRHRAKIWSVRQNARAWLDKRTRSTGFGASSAGNRS